MKSNLIFIILFFGMLSTAFGQEKITEIKYQKYDADLGEWVIRELEQTDYDEEERPVLWNSFQRYSTDTLVHSWRIETNYSTDSREEIRYQRKSGLLTATSKVTWDYDENGCVTTQMMRALEGGLESNDNLNQVVFTYKENAPPCTIDSSIFSVYVPELHTDFVPNQKDIYRYENDFKTVIKEAFIWDINNQRWNPISVLEQHFDDNDRLILRKTNGTNGLSSETTWEYDAAGRLVKVNLKQYEDGDLKYDKITTYVYELNEEGFVVKKTEEKSGSGWIRNYDYENYCDGLPKVERELNIDNLTFDETHFKYLNRTGCEPPKETLELTLFPNPTNDFVTVKSDLLFTNSATIRLFNMSGQLLQTIAINERTDEVAINIQNLSVGSYILQIISDKNVLSQPLVVAPH